MPASSKRLNDLKQAGERPRKRPATGLSRAEERALVAAARDGDERAMTRLLRIVSDPAMRFGRGFCRDDEDAQEVMQDVLAALVRSLAGFRGESALSTWAYTVARHACMRRRRRRAHAPERVESLEAAGPEESQALEVPDAEADPLHRYEKRQLGEAIERAIGELPAAQREVLVLRDVEGLPAAEVGRILGLQERAVKSRLHRARVALREALAPALGRTASGGERSRSAALGRAGGCPDTARMVSRYLEGELSPSVCATLSRHVEKCPSCGEVCDSLRAALGACRDGRRALPAEVRDQVRAAIRQLVSGWPGVESTMPRA
jgi:RNA polymerase sigma-70 factor (ECF subfamily)